MMTVDSYKYKKLKIDFHKGGLGNDRHHPSPLGRCARRTHHWRIRIRVPTCLTLAFVSSIPGLPGALRRPEETAEASRADTDGTDPRGAGPDKD